MANIIVVDDNLDILELIKIFLTMQGFQVTVCSNKEAAIEAIDKQLPDLILLDVNLSGADGREICKAIKENEKQSSVPIILFSADMDNLHNYKECKADDILPKPFELDELLNMVLTYTKNKAASPISKG